MIMSFLPDDFKPPAESGGNYTKFAQGKTTLRVLGQCINGYVVFEWDKGTQKSKPHRFRVNDQPIEGTYSDKDGKPAKVKWFMAFLAWNHDIKRIQVCEVKQKSIWEELLGFAKDPDWGDLKKYDVVINRDGVDLNTTYRTVPKPPTELSEDSLSEIREKLPLINLAALYDGEDPFAGLESTQPETQSADPF